MPWRCDEHDLVPAVDEAGRKRCDDLLNPSVGLRWDWNPWRREESDPKSGVGEAPPFGERGDRQLLPPRLPACSASEKRGAGRRQSPEAPGDRFTSQRGTSSSVTLERGYSTKAASIFRSYPTKARCRCMSQRTSRAGGKLRVERIRTGLRLVQASWDVLRADREMLLLPVLSMLASLSLLALGFFGLLRGDVEIVRSAGALHVPGVSEWITLAVLIYLLSYVTIFFNVALVFAADERMQGGDPTVGSAIAQAWQHAVAIAPWALVSVVVSGIIRAIEERGGFVGRIIGGMLGLAWALITYLVLPVLVLEGLTVREAITRSKELFVKTWGETVSGEIGMGLIGFLALAVPMPALFLIGRGGIRIASCSRSGLRSSGCSSSQL